MTNWYVLSFRDSGGGAIGSTTVRLMTVEWVFEPEVPVTVILWVPRLVMRLVVMVKVLETVPPDDRVKGFWLPVKVM